ncbi:MAG: aminotransferase class V-fold PLP-dependent enzyme [Proteobacteria bacterium]|nr:aminotransferase class V-fold PLP-dependent enzyme [Pseudomonadota bacterium]
MSDFILTSDTIQINHGSFGATPILVLDAADAWRRKFEADPTHFMRRLWAPSLAEAKAKLAAFLNADIAGLAFVMNASDGANAVLRSLDFAAGDEILVTSHGYRAVSKTVEHVCRRTGATARIVDIPFPLTGPDTVVDAIDAAITARTRLLVVDHITSPTAAVFPVAAIQTRARKRGVPVLIDGAHAPGQVPLDIAALAPDFYIGNCHKWLFAAKGAAFLYAAPQFRDRLHPGTISHGYGQGMAAEFDWVGTRDVGAWLSVPDGIAYGENLGWAQLRQRNNDLASDAAKLLSQVWGTRIGTPDSMRAHMACVEIPLTGPADEARAQKLWSKLYDAHRIQMPVIAFAGALWARPSVQIYNRAADYEALAKVDWRALDA